MSYFGFWNLLLDLDSDRNTVLFWKCICKSRLVKVGELFAHSCLFYILAFVFYFVTISIVKILQTNFTYYRGIGHALQTIIKEEGLLGLYKGLGTTLLVWCYNQFTITQSIYSFLVYLEAYWC
jgi:hypothetical protein